MGFFLTTRPSWPIIIMYKNSRRNVGIWLVMSWLHLVTAGMAMAQQTGPEPATKQPKAGATRRTPTKRPRIGQPVPAANRPAYTKKGAVRQLSPDQLWDAKPDSSRPNRGPFRLLVYAGLGLSLYSAPVKIPGSLTDERLTRLGLPMSLRVMWQTDHRLRLGVETGHTNMYNYRGTIAGDAARVRVSAIPILVVFSMSMVKRFALYAGTGPYLINSELTYDGNTRGSTFSLGWMAAGTYTQPITKNLGIAAELKWYDASQTNDACFVAQTTLIWRALTW